MLYMASTIAQLLDEESDVVRYVVGIFNLPYIRLIGHKGMSLPSYVRLPTMFQALVRVQKVLFVIVLDMWSRIVPLEMNKIVKNGFLATL